MKHSRRSFLASGVAGLCSCHMHAWGAVLPTTLQPRLDEGYEPADADERGMWQSLERLEEEIASSSLLVASPDLARYSLEVLGRLLGRSPTDMRVYILRDPSFNASMFPNGMMLLNTGFLVRSRNEAQFAAVLGHEAGHYFRKHAIEGYRSTRRKSAAAAFIAAGGTAVGGYLAFSGYGGPYWVELANSINLAIVASVFTFSRAQETEADAYGISLLGNAGYLPEAAAGIWKQLIEEQRRSAAARGKRYRPGGVRTFSTHPPESRRMRDLGDTAAVIQRANPGRNFEDGAERWRRTLHPHRAMLLDEQIKVNDPGASLHIVEQMAQDGWDGLLHFQRAEVYRMRNEKGDAERARQEYARAVEHADAPAAAWRANGYELLKSGQVHEARRSLERYLELEPGASDAQMVRFSLNQ